MANYITTFWLCCGHMSNMAKLWPRFPLQCVRLYLVIVSLLDSRLKGPLGSTDRPADCIMLPVHFETLRLDVIDHMIPYCLESYVWIERNNTDPATGDKFEKPEAVGTITLGKEELMYSGMERMKMLQKLADKRHNLWYM